MPTNKKVSENEILIGIVTPIQWDMEERVSAVGLSATDDEEYWIENSEKFLNLVQRRIEAEGTVRRDRRQSRSIFIKRYRIIEED